MSRELNALSLGADMAHHVGIRTGAAVAAGLTLATLLAATCVSLAGLIGFVGLVVPHVVRSITGPDHRRLLPACMLAGGVFLALCDALAAIVFPSQELPVGVVTALVGGPFFLTILRKRKKQGWID
jgi:iron complex transport system permease protein